MKKALDEKNADVHDKEELLRHYRAAMEKCSTAIARRHFTMDELAAKEAQGEAVPNPDDALRALEQEREQAVQQGGHLRTGQIATGVDGIAGAAGHALGDQSGHVGLGVVGNQILVGELIQDTQIRGGGGEYQTEAWPGEGW